LVTLFDEPRLARQKLLDRATPLSITTMMALALVETACASGLGFPADGSALPASPLATSDRDGDGLLDAEENELARRFAPIVILHRHDPHRPASLPWLLARTDPFAVLRRDSHSAGLLARRVPLSSTAIRRRLRAGSEDPSQWATYVHVYPRAGGGINVQYWFFYPYNDGPLFFDHEHDWEHITVRLTEEREPIAADFAQHANDRPGVSHSWSELTREGEHPLVLSALGTHASYASAAGIAWFERVANCSAPDRCPDPVWRTWQAGGLRNLGERGRPLCSESALSFRDRWGPTGLIPGTSAPYGPLFHRGYCANGLPGCDEAAPSQPSVTSVAAASGVSHVE
jgi:hypothetical protein